MGFEPEEDGRLVSLGAATSRAQIPCPPPSLTRLVAVAPRFRSREAVGMGFEPMSPCGHLLSRQARWAALPPHRARLPGDIRRPPRSAAQSLGVRRGRTGTLFKLSLSVTDRLPTHRLTCRSRRLADRHSKRVAGLSRPYSGRTTCRLGKICWATVVCRSEWSVFTRWTGSESSARTAGRSSGSRPRGFPSARTGTRSTLCRSSQSEPPGFRRVPVA